MIQRFKRICYKLFDFLAVPFVFFANCFEKEMRSRGMNKFPLIRKLCEKQGVFFTVDHYYDPKFVYSNEEIDNWNSREIYDIDFNEDGQVELLNSFNYQEELSTISEEKTEDIEYYYKNGSYESGDSDWLYCMVRKYKPQRIVEIGSGFSTLIIKRALDKNHEENSDFLCEHVCIEPYEMLWLENKINTVVREKVEDVNIELFKKMQKGDFLIIDSSHMIRPYGDVLHEYFKILPILNEGVVIHIHDIFTPRDYLKEWMIDEKRLWNEQYLLEAFLMNNKEYRIIGALNYLMHNHNELMKEKFPILKIQNNREPGAFWMVKERKS